MIWAIIIISAVLIIENSILVLVAINSNKPNKIAIKNNRTIIRRLDSLREKERQEIEKKIKKATTVDDYKSIFMQL